MAESPCKGIDLGKPRDRVAGAAPPVTSTPRSWTWPLAAPRSRTVRPAGVKRSPRLPPPGDSKVERILPEATSMRSTVKFFPDSLGKQGEANVLPSDDRSPSEECAAFRPSAHRDGTQSGLPGPTGDNRPPRRPASRARSRRARRRSDDGPFPRGGRPGRARPFTIGRPPRRPSRRATPRRGKSRGGREATGRFQRRSIRRHPLPIIVACEHGPNSASSVPRVGEVARTESNWCRRSGQLGESRAVDLVHPGNLG